MSSVPLQGCDQCATHVVTDWAQAAVPARRCWASVIGGSASPKTTFTWFICRLSPCVMINTRYRIASGDVLHSCVDVSCLQSEVQNPGRMCSCRRMKSVDYAWNQERYSSASPSSWSSKPLWRSVVRCMCVFVSECDIFITTPWSQFHPWRALFMTIQSFSDRIYSWFHKNRR